MTKARRIEPFIGIASLFLLFIGCFIVLRPFLSALLWAVILCFSSWPVYDRLEKLLRGRHTLAAGIMTLAIALILLGPFVIIGFSLADNVKALAAASARWIDAGPPEPPVWLEGLPLIGPSASDYWQQFTHDNARLMREVKRYIEPVTAWILSGGLKLGQGLLDLAMSIFISFFLFRDGVAVAQQFTSAVERIAGGNARHLLDVAGKTVRGVVYGIIGTALAQGVLAGIGFLIAGVPGAPLLALLTFFFSVVPMGPPLVWVPASVWLFYQGSTWSGVFMLIWGLLLVSSVDNVIKPLIISQGSNLPFILILFGVLGGALAFGFIGVFLGPTLLAVGFRVVREWNTTRVKAGQAIREPDAGAVA